MKLPVHRSQWPDHAIVAFEERAGIMEFQGNLTREDAERKAEEDTRLQYGESIQRRMFGG